MLLKPEHPVVFFWLKAVFVTDLRIVGIGMEPIEKLYDMETTAVDVKMQSSKQGNLTRYYNKSSFNQFNDPWS